MYGRRNICLLYPPKPPQCRSIHEVSGYLPCFLTTRMLHPGSSIIHGANLPESLNKSMSQSSIARSTDFEPNPALEQGAKPVWSVARNYIRWRCKNKYVQNGHHITKWHSDKHIGIILPAELQCLHLGEQTAPGGKNWKDL